jgi:4,4'-diaponeurosporenoate glycosyltransferase
MFVAIVACGLAIGSWLLARVRTLASVAPDASALAPPSLTVVIPARDEAHTLPVVLGSLRAQSAAPDEVIVVDDNSADATAAVATAHGARVVPAGPLPSGWAGKAHACDVGARTATGVHVLFLDADVELAPDAITRLRTLHAAAGGLVSVQPHHVPVRAYEQLSAYCNIVALMGTGLFSPHPPRRARAAFGPCLFTAATDYWRAGGHAAAPGSVVEDLALAAAFDRADLPVTCVTGGEHIRFRMYPGGPRQFVEGWSKNLATGAAGADPRAVTGTVCWIATQVAVTARLARDLTRWRRGRARFPVATVALAGVVAAQARRLQRRAGSFRWWTAFAFPVPLSAFVALFVRSWWSTTVRGTVTWRGRAIPTPRRPCG